MPTTPTTMPTTPAQFRTTPTIRRHPGADDLDPVKFIHAPGKHQLDPAAEDLDAERDSTFPQHDLEADDADSDRDVDEPDAGPDPAPAAAPTSPTASGGHHSHHSHHPHDASASTGHHVITSTNTRKSSRQGTMSRGAEVGELNAGKESWVSKQRRRWESNPLEPGCSRSPGRLAPASSRCEAACPRQESNLVLDLRRVVCESVTLRGR